MNPINGLKSLFLILLLSSIAFGQSDGIKWIRYGGGGVFSFSPDGRKLVTGGGLGNLIVWDLDKRKPQTIFNMPNKGSLSNIRCSFSSGGDSLLVSNGEMDIVFYYWDIVKSEIVGRTQVTIPYPYYGNVTCSGKQFAITSNNNSVGTIYIGNSDIGITDSLVGHESGVLGALFFHSGDRLASWSNDGTIRIWDVTSQKELVRIHHNQTEIAGVAISDSANCICAFCSDSTLRAYDLSDGSLKYIFPSKFSFYTRVILNPSASSTHGALYTWDTDPLWDSMITIIDLKDGSIIKKIQGINCRVGDATFSPSDSQMSVFLVNGALMLYDGNTWKITDSLSGESQSVSSLLYSRKSNEILCGGDSHDILYLNSEDGRLSHAMRNIAWGISNTILSLSPNEKYLAMSGSSPCRLLDLESNRTILLEDNYDHWEYSADDLDNLQFLSDSLLFYTYKSAGLYPGDCHSYAATAEISNDSIIHVRRTWPVYFSFDGSVGLPRTRQVVVEFGGCDEPITLFSSLISPTLDGNSAFPGISFRGRAGRCDADGTRLLTVGNDSIYLWNIADGSLLKSYAGHYGACKPIGFSQNGMYFFTFGVSDSSVRVWETASGNNTKTYRPYLLNPSTAILTPNGDNIIVGYDDGTIVDLDIGPDLSIGSKPPNPTAEVSLSCVPNPISASSIITFRIYRPSSVRITLSSVLGIELCTLYDGFSDGNEEKLPISSKVDIGGYSKGIYLMTIRSASERRTLKVLKMD